ncbi:MAG: O-antigen ligase family protein [Bacteroidaceae bacterium]|nr:O-antigen ligase family protein [Bacteroidaceae bacterium]MBQ8116180.1 O-antigen ligase family protein [Prevotella sp.]
MRSGFISTTVYIVFLMVCIAAAVDTHLFVYPSLSRSLLMECGLLLLALVAFCHRALCGTVRPVGGLCVFVALWTGYILLHGRLSEVTELYRTVYLCVTLLSVISLSYCLRAGLLTQERIYSGLLVIGLIHVFCVFAQWMGFMEPESSMYPVTGACDNPNVTAMYLVGCVPLIVHRLRCSDRKVAYVLFLFLALFAVVLLRCRTAYIGLAVEAAVFFLFSSKDSRIKGFHLQRETNCNPKIHSSIGKVFLAVVTLLVVSVAAVRMYQMKRDSADGRLLVWKVSASMIAEHPMGCGYGLYPKHYNLRQAEYFHEEHGTETERRNASFVYMAYNDFLEHGVEGGVIGMLFLMGFYVLIIKDPPLPSKGGRCLSAVFSAFAVMSLVNFVVAGIQTWLLVVCCAAVVAAGCSRADEPEEAVGGHSLLLQRLVSVALVVFVLMLSVITGRMTYAQYHLGRIEERMSVGEAVSDSVFADLEKYIYSSEAFWRLRAHGLMRTGDYGQATLCIDNAMRYTAAPLLCYMAHRCLSELGREADGIGYINEVYHTQPTLLMPKLILMRFNDSKGDTVTAMKYANEIVNTEAKVSDRKTAAIVREAEMYLERK